MPKNHQAEKHKIEERTEQYRLLFMTLLSLPHQKAG
jgi:hypothetical protein